MCLPPTRFPALLLIYVSVSVGGCLFSFGHLRQHSARLPLVPSCDVHSSVFFSVMFLSPGHRFTSANELFPSPQSLAAIAAVRIFSASCLRAPSSVVSFCSRGSPHWTAAGAAHGDLSHCSLIAPLRLWMHQQWPLLRYLLLFFTSTLTFLLPLICKLYSPPCLSSPCPVFIFRLPGSLALSRPQSV